MNRGAEPPHSAKTAPEDGKQPAVVLGPLLEADPIASDSEPLHDRRIPARTMADRPRVEILADPATDSSAIPQAGPEIEARLAGIQKNLDRLESALAVQAQRPPVDVVQQTAEILKLLREAREFENASSPSPTVAAPDESDKPAKIASNATDLPPEKKIKDYDADLDRTVQPAPAPPQTATKIYHPRYLSGSALQALVAPLLTREFGKVGATDAGTDESALAAGGDSSPAPVSVLVVRDLPEVLRKIDDLVKEVDVPPLPVKIEATVITLRLDEARPHGVDLLEFNAANRGFVLSPAAGSVDASASPPQAADATQLTHGFGLKCGVLQGDPRAFINVLQTAASLQRANSWQISVLNRQSAQLVLNDAAANTGAATTTLKVRPIVTPDGVVHLDVRRDNESDGRATGNRSGALTHQIALRDGQTAVVGGFFSEQLASYTYSTTGFGSMPFFGKRFRKQVDVLDRSETIVLLTPHVAYPVEDAPGVTHRNGVPKAPPRGRPILKETAATSRFFGRKTDTAPTPYAMATQIPPRRLPPAATNAKPISRDTVAEVASEPTRPKRSADSTPNSVLSQASATTLVRVEDPSAAEEVDGAADGVAGRMNTIPESPLPSRPQIVPNR